MLFYTAQNCRSLLLLNTLPLANEDKLITLTMLTSEGGAAVYQLYYVAKMEVVGFTPNTFCAATA